MSGPWWTHVAVDPAAIVGLAGVSALYLRGQRHRRRAGAAIVRGRTTTFFAGVAATLLALAGPVPAWSDQLLWAHMVQHLLLTVVAAPLLALGSPVATVRLAFPAAARGRLADVSRRTRRLRRRAGDPPMLAVATALHIAVTWLWHAPWLYDLAVRTSAVHALEHVTFLGTAVWVWIEVVATARRNRRAQAVATLCLAALIATGGVLGALLTFAGRSVYTVYTGGGGLTALEDQQLAGALMWVPPSFVYATVAVRRFGAWIDSSERDLRRREQRERAAVSERDHTDPVVAPEPPGPRTERPGSAPSPAVRPASRVER